MGPVHSASIDKFCDAACGLAGVFVFPDPDRLPTEGMQPLIGIGISGSIGFDLLAPEIGIALRPGSVLGTPVPEASIDEDGHLRAAENDVSDAPWLLKERNVKTIAQSSGMQRPAEVNFRTRALLSHAGHPLAGVRRRGLCDCHFVGPSPSFQAVPDTFRSNVC